ncbi:hypothetical protein H4R99_008568, partial [Coemansia sp. RSA 1722]
RRHKRWTQAGVHPRQTQGSIPVDPHELQGGYNGHCGAHGWLLRAQRKGPVDGDGHESTAWPQRRQPGNNPHLQWELPRGTVLLDDSRDHGHLYGPITDSTGAQDGDL